MLTQLSNARETRTCQTCNSQFVAWKRSAARFCSCKCYGISRRGSTKDRDEHWRLKNIWKHMKKRCYSKSSEAYQLYGARGVQVWSGWRNSFATFMEWSRKNGYADNLSIDRIDPRGNYEPSNCRWTTQKNQSVNRRKRFRKATSRYKGVHWSTQFKKWRVLARNGTSCVYCGLFTNELEAAISYDDAIAGLHGEFAFLNFPERYGRSTRQRQLKQEQSARGTQRCDPPAG